jgi:hypothetical protein
MIGFIDTVYTPLRTTGNYSAIYPLYNSLLHPLVSSVSYSLTSHFLATDFNTGTIKVSLNHTLLKSLNYSTHKVFSSQPDFQLSTELTQIILMPQFSSSTPKLISWQAGVLKLN